MVIERIRGAMSAVNLARLAVIVSLGVGKLPAQAVAIALRAPLDFVGNKLWSFRSGAPAASA